MYAKTIDLSAEKEPDIYRAIRRGAILENVGFFPGTNTVDFSDKSKTENTRVSYPINFIDNALKKSVGGAPKKSRSFREGPTLTGLLNPGLAKR